MNTPHNSANTILVFVPVGKEVETKHRPATAAQRAHGSPFVIGLLDNHKHNSAQVLDRLQQRLAEKIPGAQFVRAKKPEAGKGASKQMLDDLASRCQAVVTGIGD
jgi:GGDEF domain-containing protein